MESYVDAHNLCGIESLSFQDLLVDPRQLTKDELLNRNKRTVEAFGKGLYLPARRSAIEIAHLEFCRGRTFENCYIIVDEVGNFTPYEMKQLYERVGINSTLAIIGDPFQVDNPLLDEEFNGLVYSANKLYGNASFPRNGLIQLDENFRSQLAEESRKYKAPRDY